MLKCINFKQLPVNKIISSYDNKKDKRWPKGTNV